MASEEKKEEKTKAKTPRVNPIKGIPVPVLVNTALIGVVFGLLIYTRLIYRHPVITEETERERLNHLYASPTPLATPGLISFDPFTVNIQSYPPQPKSDEGSPIQGKLHYASVGFALEIRDNRQKDQAESLRALILDRVISILGRKSYHELTTVQGRYLLRSQIINSVNQLANTQAKIKSQLISQVFFTQFIVQ